MPPNRSIPQQAEVDEMELEARAEADEVFGEWLMQYYGDRGVPGNPPPGEMDGMNG